MRIHCTYCKGTGRYRWKKGMLISGMGVKISGKGIRCQYCAGRGWKSGKPGSGVAWISPRMKPPATSSHNTSRDKPPLINAVRRIISGVKVHIEHDVHSGIGVIRYAPWRKVKYGRGEYEPPLYGWFEEFLRNINEVLG